jgi:RHS repeat-associated protein
VRVAQEIDGQLTRWVQTLASHCTSYNGLSNSGCGLPQVLVETTGAESTLYIYGLNRLAQVKGNDVEWFLGDALGSVRQLVNDDGDVILARDYTPYGQPLSASGTGSSRYAFTGEQWDSDVALLFLRARHYALAVGRFLSQDPWNGSIQQPGTLHKYIYVLNNPIRYRDPTGHVLDSGGLTGAPSVYADGPPDGDGIFPPWEVEEFDTLGFRVSAGVAAFIVGLEVKIELILDPQNPSNAGLFGGIDLQLGIEEGGAVGAGVVLVDHLESLDDYGGWDWSIASELATPCGGLEVDWEHSLDSSAYNWYISPVVNIGEEAKLATGPGWSVELARYENAKWSLPAWFLELRKGNQ